MFWFGFCHKRSIRRSESINDSGNPLKGLITFNKYTYFFLFFQFSWFARQKRKKKHYLSICRKNSLGEEKISKISKCSQISIGE